ncbi:MAG: hypothetical protein IKK10_00815 [Clostridia bacterium]|nr:hypothetical protein [Clostridia bacterium]
MKQKRLIIILSSCVVGLILLLLAILGINNIVTNIVENTNAACVGEMFSGVYEAFEAYEAEERALNDTSLDYCPPYEVVYSFEYDGNQIAFYKYCWDFDSDYSNNYAVRILKNNKDGTVSFTGGFADFYKSLPSSDMNYYYYTNIDTSKGEKSISLIYLPIDSDNDVYIDGNKAEKIPVSIDGEKFYICYALSNRDTILSNLFTDIDERHRVEVR